MCPHTVMSRWMDGGGWEGGSSSQQKATSKCGGMMDTERHSLAPSLEVLTQREPCVGAEARGGVTGTEQCMTLTPPYTTLMNTKGPGNYTVGKAAFLTKHSVRSSRLWSPAARSQYCRPNDTEDLPTEPEACPL